MNTLNSQADYAAFMPDPPSHFSVENSLSEELMRLTLKDRLAIEEEIHGVRCGAMEETPQLIAKSLQDFDNKLNCRKEEAEASPEIDLKNIRKLLRNVIRTGSSTISQSSSPTTNSSPLSDAVMSDGSSRKEKINCYLNDDTIRLRFLRCECFDVDKALERFISFLELNSELFGDYVCERQMSISDFHTKDEVNKLKTSRTQYLPFRDRSGRRILASVGTANFHMDNITRQKILMYFHWVVSKDIETQRKGIVIILWPFNEDEGGDLNWEKAIRPYLQKDASEYAIKMNGAMPVRVASRQMYYKDTPFWKTLSALYVFYTLKPHEKPIYKAHFGDHTELLYKLGSYGIPNDLLQISVTGVVKYGNLIAWLGFLRNRERSLKNENADVEEIVDCPRTYDVIFRKGTTFRHNPGNTFYRGLIEKYSAEHSRGNKKTKYDITLRIVSEVEKQNGRFLEWAAQQLMWVVMTDRDRVRKKIAAAFKQFFRKRKVEGAPDSNRAKQRKELNGTVQNAEYIFDNDQKKHLMINGIGFNDDDRTSLQRYYSLDYVGKRQRLENCACFR